MKLKLLTIFILIPLFLAGVSSIQIKGVAEQTKAEKTTIKPEDLNITYGATEEFKEQKENVQKLTAYFQKYNCPLLPYAEDFIYEADVWGIDWKLLPAISMQESSCGKRYLHNNPFGFGYYKFADIPSAISYVAQAISGNNPNEKAYHLKSGNKGILFIYNGRVNPQYPEKVIDIMLEIGGGK